MNIFIIVFAAIVFKMILAFRRSFRTLVSLAGLKTHKKKHWEDSKIIRRLMVSGEQGLPLGQF